MIDGDLPLQMDIGITTPCRDMDEGKNLDIEYIRDKLEEKCGVATRTDKNFLIYNPSESDLQYRIHGNGGINILGKIDFNKWNLVGSDKKPEEMKNKFFNHITQDFEKMLMNLAECDIDASSYHSITEDYDNLSSSLEENNIEIFKNLFNDLSILNEKETFDLSRMNWGSGGYKLKDKNGLVRCFIWDAQGEIEIYYLGNFLYDDSFNIDFLDLRYKYVKKDNPYTSPNYNPDNEVYPEKPELLRNLEPFASDLKDGKNHISVSLKDFNLEFGVSPFEDGTRITYPNTTNFEEIIEGIQGIQKIVKLLENEKLIKEAREHAENRRLRNATELVEDIKNVLGDHTHPEVSYIEGLISFHNEDYDKALSKFKDAIEKSEVDNFVEPFNMKAEIHIMNGDYEEAREDLKRSLDINSDQSKIGEKLENLDMRLRIKEELEQISGLQEGQKDAVIKYFEEGKEKLKKEEAFILDSEFNDSLRYGGGTINENVRNAFKDNYHPLSSEAQITHNIVNPFEGSLTRRHKPTLVVFQDENNLFNVEVYKRGHNEIPVYKRDKKGARSCLDKIKEISDSSPQAYCLEGLIFFHEGKYEKAVELLEKAYKESNNILFLDPLDKLVESLVIIEKRHRKAHYQMDKRGKASKYLSKSQKILEITSEILEESFDGEEVHLGFDIDSELDQISNRMEVVSSMGSIL